MASTWRRTVNACLRRLEVHLARWRWFLLPDVPWLVEWRNISVASARKGFGKCYFSRTHISPFIHLISFDGYQCISFQMCSVCLFFVWTFVWTLACNLWYVQVHFSIFIVFIPRFCWGVVRYPIKLFVDFFVTIQQQQHQWPRWRKWRRQNGRNPRYVYGNLVLFGITKGSCFYWDNSKPNLVYFFLRWLLRNQQNTWYSFALYITKMVMVNNNNSWVNLCQMFHFVTLILALLLRLNPTGRIGIREHLFSTC